MSAVAAPLEPGAGGSLESRAWQDWPSFGSRGPCPPAQGSRALGSVAVRARLQLWGSQPCCSAWFTAQPAEKSALEELGIETIGLRPSMFARYRNARRVDHIGLDLTGAQPARQPEA